MARLADSAPAKVNLTLRVLARRADGYHDLASLVAFAAIGDSLTLEPDDSLSLAVDGPMAAAAGPVTDNLVLTAARALAGRIHGIKLGRFTLTKNLPAGAGLGGGSSDAAAALRLVAHANDITLDERHIFDAARATGADVAVCLDPRARLMHGVGDRISPPLRFPQLDAVLVFPARPLATADVFRAVDPARARRTAEYSPAEIPMERMALLRFLAEEGNDLEEATAKLAPAVHQARALLESTSPHVVRMSGAGSAMFALYGSASAAESAAGAISKQRPDWWVKATTLA
jgi:4-diphosphocytidyl-2-C-methyl-D-erythritol kinase